MPDAVAALFAQLEHLSLSGQFDRIEDLYEEPLVHVRPDETVVHHRRGDFIRLTEIAIDRLRQRGFDALTYKLVDLRSFIASLVMVDVQWKYANGKGEALAEGFTTYVLRKTHGEWRIAVQISQADPRVFPPD